MLVVPDKLVGYEVLRFDKGLWKRVFSTRCSMCLPANYLGLGGIRALEPASECACDMFKMFQCECAVR